MQADLNSGTAGSCDCVFCSGFKGDLPEAGRMKMGWLQQCPMAALREATAAEPTSNPSEATQDHAAAGTLRAELEKLKVSALRKRATAAGLPEAEVEAAEDSEDVSPKEALISLLMQAAELETQKGNDAPCEKGSGTA
eukprot:SAG31_NODE_1587_length_7819_cov_3.703277_5_plen_138_part_00